MRVIYDPDQDILQIAFREDPVEQTAQIAPGLILDYDKDDNLVSLELRKASRRVDNPYAIAYVVGQADLTKPRPKSGESA